MRCSSCTVPGAARPWCTGGDMPFNQQMSFPCELSLRSTPGGIWLGRQPVKEGVFAMRS